MDLSSLLATYIIIVIVIVVTHLIGVWEYVPSVVTLPF